MVKILASYGIGRTAGFNKVRAPGTNVSNLQLNPDGSIRSLGGYTEISSVTGTGREGIDERVIRIGLRASF